MKLVAIVAAATPFTDLPLSARDASWDAGAAEKAMTGAAELKRGHFWQDTSEGADPEAKSSYKLPFVADGKANWGGITAAAQRLSATSLPSGDLSGVQNHIARYYKKAAGEYGDDTIKPPWEKAAITAALGVDGMEWQATALDFSRPTSDGRQIMQDGFTMRTPPLALLYTPTLQEGHDGAFQVGTIQRVYVAGTLLELAGTWLDSPDPEMAAKIADVEQRVANGDGLSVSVDLAVQKASVTLEIPGEEEAEIDDAIEAGEDVTVTIPLVDTEKEVLVVEQCELVGLTIVPQPAQDGLSIVNLAWENPDVPEPQVEQTEPVVAAALEVEPPVIDDPLPEPIPESLSLDHMTIFEGATLAIQQARAELQKRHELAITAMREEHDKSRVEHAMAMEQMRQLMTGMTTALTAAAGAPTNVTLPDIHVEAPAPPPPAHVEVHPAQVTVEMQREGARRITRDKQGRVTGSEPIPIRTKETA